MEATITKLNTSERLDYCMEVILREINKDFMLFAEYSNEIPTEFSKILDMEIPKNPENYISHKSSLGKVIYGCQVGDQVIVDGPKEILVYEVIGII